MREAEVNRHLAKLIWGNEACRELYPDIEQAHAEALAEELERERVRINDTGRARYIMSSMWRYRTP